MQQALDFGGAGLGVLAADAFPGNVTRQLVQLQRQSQALLTGHTTVTLDLFFQCHCRSHDFPIAQFASDYNYNAAPVADLITSTEKCGQNAVWSTRRSHCAVACVQGSIHRLRAFERAAAGPLDTAALRWEWRDAPRQSFPQ